MSTASRPIASPVQDVAVDLGGTWTRVQAYSSSGRVIQAYRGPSVSTFQFPKLLKGLLKKWGRPQRILIASRGIWTATDRAWMRKPLLSSAKIVHVISDVEAAWLAAFHGQAEGGILVISGTGSIAFGKIGKHAARSGGLGPLLGDEGSGFWIGREWLKRSHQEANLSRLLRILHSSDNLVRKMASYTPTVLKKSQAKHAVAQTLIEEAQDHLIHLIEDLAVRLPWKSDLPISFAGSVAQDPRFSKGLIQRLRHRLKRYRPVVVEAETDPMLAMVRYL